MLGRILLKFWHCRKCPRRISEDPGQHHLEHLRATQKSLMVLTINLLGHYIPSFVWFFLLPAAHYNTRNLGSKSWMCFCRNSTTDRLGRTEWRIVGWRLEKQSQEGDAQGCKGPPSSYIMCLPNHSFHDTIFNVQQCESGGKCSICKIPPYRKFNF